MHLAFDGQRHFALDSAFPCGKKRRRIQDKIPHAEEQEAISVVPVDRMADWRIMLVKYIPRDSHIHRCRYSTFCSLEGSAYSIFIKAGYGGISNCHPAIAIVVASSAYRNAWITPAHTAGWFVA